MTAAAEALDAAGPEEIRAAFGAAIATAGEHAGDLTGVAGVLGEAAERYESLQMSSSTLELLRNAAGAVGAAAAALGTADERLQAALSDFNARDGQVGDAVAEAGNLMQPEGYTTTFSATGIQEQPMTSTPTSAPPSPRADTGPADEAGERPERDRLARGFYIDGWPQDLQRDRARQWDAGRVSEQEKADAYEVADKLLADQAAIASGPGADRLEMMRDNGITRCPSWCPQPDDEDQHEAHVGPGSTFTTDDGDTVTVRPRVSWWSDTEPTIEIAVTPGEGGDGTLALSAAELAKLQQLSTKVMGEAQRQHQYAPDDATKPAYPGAVLDEADATYDVSAPDAAAEALDLTSRASGYYFNETDGDDTDARYLDWSGRDRATQERHLEVGDGTDTATLGLSSDEMRELRDGIGRLVGAVDDGQDDPGAMYPGDEDDGAYIDWSCAPDGVRSIEFGDGNTAAVLEMPEARLREFYERLVLQVQLDEQDNPA